MRILHGHRTPNFSKNRFLRNYSTSMLDEQPQKIDLGAALNELLTYAGDYLKGINVQGNYADNPIQSIDAPKLSFERIFLNLILNAAQWTDSNGGKEISIDTFYDDSKPSITVSIKDSGPGIEPERQRQIFQPNYTTRQGGTGLGLFVVQHYARQLGYDINLQSEVGKGSTFSVSIPLKKN